MRKTKVIHIGGEGAEGQDVTVLEIQVRGWKSCRDLIAMAGSDASDSLLLAIVLDQENEQVQKLLPLMTDLGDKILDLGSGDCMDVAEAWIEVNQGFFDRLKAVTQKAAKERSEKIEPKPEAKPEPKAA